MFFHNQWRNHLKLLRESSPVGPRGFATREVLDHQFTVDSTYNLLDVPARGLNYRFAVAEWVWMMAGHSDVGSIGQYNSVMHQFSDDGLWLTGAYGPHIKAQTKWILDKLRKDPDTRQAVIEILRPRKETKDEPCTLSFQYLLRRGALHCIVTMRSNDVWLGTPYDIFTFTMIQNCFAGELGVPRGWLSLRAGSFHLYDRDLPAVGKVLLGESGTTLKTPDLPGLPPYWLSEVMRTRSANSIPMKDGWPDYAAMGPWAMFAHVLLSKTSDDARAILRDVSAGRSIEHAVGANVT